MATNFLKDKAFLDKLDTLPVKEQYVRITVLSWDEKPIQEIQGRVVNAGALTLDGTSTVRRTCTLTMFAEEQENDLTQVDQLFSVNKKVKLELGIKNTVPSYTQTYVIRDEKNQAKAESKTIDYLAMYGEMVWFPLGIYVMFNPGLNHSLQGVTISLQLRDKMSLLNGDAGGVITSAVTFHERDQVLEDGSIEITKPTIRQIIQECVNHFGGEALTNIVIEDLDERVKQVVQYLGGTPLYLLRYVNAAGAVSYEFSVSSSAATSPYLFRTFNTGEDVGFVMTDFVYPGELIGDAGTTVTNILDEIIKVLGNYEYFYDVDGVFHFQEIKNYLNTSYVKQAADPFNSMTYQTDVSSGRSVYTFEGSKLVSATTNNPRFDNIKNDFVVWGLRKGIEGIELPIRFHLSIDQKPQTGHTYTVWLYEDEFGVIRAMMPTQYDSRSDFPQTGRRGKLYKDMASEKCFRWDDETETYVDATSEAIEKTTVDWREEYYYQGLEAEAQGIDYPYYYTELSNEFPKLFDLDAQEFKEEVSQRPADLDFFLDMIDVNTEMGQYSVPNIGRRSKVISDNDINCIFESDIPDLVFIDITKSTDEIAQEKAECTRQGQDWVQVSDDIYSLLSIGGSANSAYNMICDLLYQYTNMNNTISITALPVFYLEPNTRITVRDDATGIYGDYMISSVTIPLGHSETMSISAYKALQKI